MTCRAIELGISVAVAHAEFDRGRASNGTGRTLLLTGALHYAIDCRKPSTRSCHISHFIRGGIRVGLRFTALFCLNQFCR